MNEESNSSASTPAKSSNSSSSSTQFALAMDLPFVLVGAVLLGGVVGYFLDRWLHTKPALMLVFGALGFFGGVRDVLRRLSGKKNGSSS